MSIFKCNHVSYSYDKNTNVLKDITFSFELGKVYAILGSSGSGKTTLLSLLGGLDIPTTGTILYENEDIKKIHGLHDYKLSGVKTWDRYVLGNGVVDMFRYVAERIKEANRKIQLIAA